MADRPPQGYPLLPPGFNGINPASTVLQAQQQYQQQQQQQQQHPQHQGDSHPGPSFPAAIWQQQMSQQQFRPRSGAGMTPQQAQQMNDLMRSQNMARVASGQQQGMSFPMGVGMPNMGGQQPFHDQPSNQPNMPGGAFGGMPNAMTQAALQQRMQNQPGALRNFEAMMQHNLRLGPGQQLSQRPDQQQQQPSQQPPFVNSSVNHPGPSDIFSSPAMSNEAIRRPSPSHSSNMMPVMSSNIVNGGPMNQQPQPRRVLSNSELNERANQLRHMIQNGENAINSINMQSQMRGQPLTPELQQRVKQLTEDVMVKKGYLQRIVATLSGQNPQGLPQQGGGGGAGPSGSPWMHPPNQPQGFDSPGSVGRPGPGPSTPVQHQQSPHPPGIQGSPSIGKPQGTGNHMPNQATLPQRTDSVQPGASQGPQPPQLPQQQQQQLQQGDASASGAGPFQLGPMGANTNGQHPFQPQPNGNNGPGPGMQQGGPSGIASQAGPIGLGDMQNVTGIAQLVANIPPMDRLKFEQTYRNFCQKKNINPSMQTQIENKPIDLHLLHASVMHEGGAAKVDQRGSWDVIGGRLGFVQFPGNDTEPSKSGPMVAHQISRIYKEYLQSFDTFYLASALDSRNKAGAGPQFPNPALVAAAITGNNQITKSAIPSALAAGAAQLRLSAAQMTQLMAYANRSSAELKSIGLPDHVLQYIENNRILLQRAYNEQDNRSRNGQALGMMGNGGQAPPMNADQPQQNGSQGGLPANGMGPPGIQPPSFGPMAVGQSQMPDRRIMTSSLSQGGMPNPGGNFMERPQGPQMIPPPPLPQMQPAGQQLGPMVALSNAGRPNQEHLRLAMAYVNKAKNEFTSTTLPAMPHRDIPPDQRAQYNQLLEQLFRYTSENEPNLPMCFVLVKDENAIKRMVAITCTVAYQRHLVSSGQHRTVLTIDSLRGMLQEVARFQEVFQNALRNVQQNSAQQQHIQRAPQHPMLQNQQMLHMQHGPSPMNMSSPASHPGPDMPRNQMPNIQPSPPNIPPPPAAQQHTPQLSSQSLRLQNPPARRTQKPANAATPTAGISSPSPAPMTASTPTHSAATPSAVTGSPQLPKSPKVKIPATKKPAGQTRRRPSTSTNKGATSSPSVPNAPTPQSHASPETASTPTQSSSSKRPRDDEGSNVNGPSPGPSGDSEVANGPSPPKRVKRDEMTPSASSSTSSTQATVPQPPPEKPIEPAKKAPEVASEAPNATEESSANFLDQMTELIKLAAGQNEGQESVMPDISETLEMLLKGYNPDGESSNGFGSDFNAGGSGSGNTQKESSPGPSLSFDEIFDFSTMPDEEDSKDTPDLVQSSTNPSPESNASETDPGHTGGSGGMVQGDGAGGSGAAGVKLEPKTESSSDVLPAGLWKEMDGGEAAYYQSSEWKWDGHMPDLDQPWAIFN
ncbi:hypothetical protein CC2G_007395 [Coprinopsis cinerea AmutBmut pab1-1]|nr:hypothetical protein CC2G_007395 [Coprinopsis cinerea AmutBmut pab1-1]